MLIQHFKRGNESATVLTNKGASASTAVVIIIFAASFIVAFTVIRYVPAIRLQVMSSAGRLSTKLREAVARLGGLLLTTNIGERGDIETPNEQRGGPVQQVALDTFHPQHNSHDASQHPVYSDIPPSFASPVDPHVLASPVVATPPITVGARSPVAAAPSPTIHAPPPAHQAGFGARRLRNFQAIRTMYNNAF